MSHTPTPPPNQPQAAPEITGKMFLYQKPELLTVQAHRDLGLSPAEHPFGFAAKVRALPLTVSEVVIASRDYPVVFMSPEEPLPMAVVGLVEDVNLFVDEKGAWEADAYVPGYVRRYPFGIAAEQNSDRFAVVIDRGFEGLKENGDQPLFSGDQPSQFTQDAIEFTKRYEQDRQLTAQFMAEIKKFDILSGQTAQYTPKTGGTQVPFANYLGLDEAKLRDLPDDRFLEIRRLGLLPVLYGQAMSMNNWRNIVSRRARRYGLNEANLFNPAPVS